MALPRRLRASAGRARPCVADSLHRLAPGRPWVAPGPPTPPPGSSSPAGAHPVSGRVMGPQRGSAAGAGRRSAAAIPSAVSCAGRGRGENGAHAHPREGAARPLRLLPASVVSDRAGRAGGRDGLEVGESLPWRTRKTRKAPSQRRPGRRGPRRRRGGGERSARPRRTRPLADGSRTNVSSPFDCRTARPRWHAAGDQAGALRLRGAPTPRRAGRGRGSSASRVLVVLHQRSTRRTSGARNVP